VRLCVAVPGQRHAIDAVTKVDGELMGQFSNLPVATLIERNPGAIVCSLDQFAAEADELAITEPEPITKKQWWDALEALPPIRWRTVLGVELFQFSERYTGNVTGTYARIGARYWRWYDRDNEPHEQLAHKAGRALRRAEQQDDELTELAAVLAGVAL